LPSEPTMEFLLGSLQESANAQPMTVFCLHCPKWKATGTAQETRAASEAHRVEEHPELVGRKVARKKRVFSQAMSAEREAQIEEERRQRMRALGIL
jgi:hypothetical protein